MRVLLATSFPVPGEYDGTAMLPIKIMRALRSRGISVVIAHLRARPPWGKPTVEDFEGTPVFDLSPPFWVRGLKQIHSRFPFDLVHAQHHGGANRALFACGKYDWPLVYELHSLLGAEVERDRLGRGLAFRINHALERRVRKRADAIIVLGEQVKRTILAESPIDEERIEIIYPGIDLDEYRDLEPARAIAGVDPGDRVVMYIGSIVHPNQGVPLLIASLPRVFASVPPSKCVLVGGPAEAGETYRRELGAFGDRLIVISGQTPEQVAALSLRADVLVHPRLACRENFSVQSKIAVYLAAGRPIVATDFADYNTILGDTGAGLLCKPDPGSIAEAVVKTLTDDRLARSLALAAGPVAREYFGMDRNIERYLDVYARAIAARRGQGAIRAPESPDRTPAGV